jgi:hypothetical protein
VSSACPLPTVAYARMASCSLVRRQVGCCAINTPVHVSPLLRAGSLRDPFRGAPSIVHSHRALLSPRFNGKTAGVRRQSDTQQRTFFDSHEDAHGAQRTVSLNRNPSNGATQTGIGIVFGRPEVGTDDDDGGAALPYTIHRVSKDGTAFQSGLIHEGDLLVKVNGASVADMTGNHRDS